MTTATELQAEIQQLRQAEADRAATSPEAQARAKIDSLETELAQALAADQAQQADQLADAVAQRQAEAHEPIAPALAAVQDALDHLAAVTQALDAIATADSQRIRATPAGTSPRLTHSAYNASVDGVWVVPQSERIAASLAASLIPVFRNMHASVLSDECVNFVRSGDPYKKVTN